MLVKEFFKHIYDVKDEDGQPWLIELTKQQLSDLDLIKQYSIDIVDKNIKDVTTGATVSDVTQKPMSIPDQKFNIYWLDETYNVAQKYQHHISGNTKNIFNTFCANCQFPDVALAKIGDVTD